MDQSWKVGELVRPRAGGALRMVKIIAVTPAGTVMIGSDRPAVVGSLEQPAWADLDTPIRWN